MWVWCLPRSQSVSVTGLGGRCVPTWVPRKCSSLQMSLTPPPCLLPWSRGTKTKATSSPLSPSPDQVWPWCDRAPPSSRASLELSMAWAWAPSGAPWQPPSDTFQPGNKRLVPGSPLRAGWRRGSGADWLRSGAEPGDVIAELGSPVAQPGATSAGDRGWRSGSVVALARGVCRLPILRGCGASAGL